MADGKGMLAHVLRLGGTPST